MALRTLCSQGWLTQHVDNTHNTVQFEINEASAIAFLIFTYIKKLLLLKFSENYSARKFEIEPYEKLEKLYKTYKQLWN